MQGIATASRPLEGWAPRCATLAFSIAVEYIRRRVRCGWSTEQEDEMRIVFIGTGTGVPTQERRPAGIAIQQDEHHLLLDSGSGTISGLVRAGLDYRSLETLIYTHSHADHTLDLVALVHALNFTPGYQHHAALRVIGPAGFSSFVDHLMSAYPSLAQRGYPIHVQEMDGSQEDLGWGRLAAAAVPHGNAPANSYRIETADGVAVFTGDCSPSDSLRKLALGADLLVSEASFPVPVPEGQHHLTTADAARIAAEAKVKTLVLTHFYPWPEPHDVAAECARYFSGKVIAARDGLVLELRAGEVAVLGDGAA
jgi:ribonuclease BN (tRNA processing enzyme)